MTSRTSRPVKRPSKPKKSTRAKAGNAAALAAIVTLEQREVLSGRAVLIHALTGAGKTVLALHKAPRPLLVLDCDNGLDSVYGTYKSDEVHIWQPEDGHDFTWPDLDNFRDYVKAGDWMLPYKTIVVDNATMAQAPIIAWSNQELIDRAGSDPDKVAKIDPDVPSQQGWGKIYRVMDRWVRDIRDAKRRGVDVIFTAGTAEWLDPGEGYVKLMPDLEGKVRTRIATHFDAVGYLENDDDGRKLILGPSGTFVTKARLPVAMHGKMPDEIEDPDYVSMMDAVRMVEKKGARSKATATKKKTATTRSKKR